MVHSRTVKMPERLVKAGKWRIWAPFRCLWRIARWAWSLRRRGSRRVCRLWRDPSLRRRIVLGLIAFVITAATAVFAYAAIYITVGRHGEYADRLAEVTAWLAGGTLGLALVAALVALLAFAAATGQPDIEIAIEFPALSKPNTLSYHLKTYVPEGGTYGGTLDYRIRLHNKSKYSAQNPALVLRFQGFGVTLSGGMDNEWSILTDAAKSGLLGLQWDGGPAYSIHGAFTRQLTLPRAVASGTTAKPGRR
jgi:hypothetical protein